MSDLDPNKPRNQASRYRQIAYWMTDDQTVQALQELARDFLNRAERTEAASHKPSSRCQSS